MCVEANNVITFGNQKKSNQKILNGGKKMYSSASYMSYRQTEREHFITVICNK